MPVRFYRIGPEGAASAAAPLLEKALAAGLPVAVRCGPGLGVAEMDALLWTYDDAAFLPHGREDEPRAARQPVLLVSGPGPAANGARALMLVGGAAVGAEEFAAWERVWLIFDGEDAEAVEAARADWRRVRDSGVEAEFWARQGGRWEKVASSG